MKKSWKIGKYFIFRSAGFPFDLMEKIKFEKAFQAMGKWLEKGRLESHRQILEEIFAEELYEKRLRLQKISSMPRFQEAIFHQNQNDYQDGAYARILNFSQQEIKRNVRNRPSKRKELLAYSYLQRFCTKNETVSFFGPSFIGKFAKIGKNIELKQTDLDKIKNRKVYTAIHLLKKISDSIINDNDEIFMMLKPRLVPTVYLDGENMVDGVNGRKNKLSKVDYRIISLIAQGNTVGRVSLELKRMGIGQKQVLNRLREFIKERFLLSGLEINAKVPEADEYLFSKLSKIPSAIKNEWFVRLNKLIQLKNKFEKGDLTNRLNTITELRKTFSSLLTNPEARYIRDEKGFFTEYCELNLKRLNLGNNLYHNLQDNLNLILKLACFNESKINKLKSSLLYEWLRNNFRNQEIDVKDAFYRITDEKERKNPPFKFGNLDLSHNIGESLPRVFLDLVNQNRETSLARFNKTELEKRLTAYLDKSDYPAATTCDILICAPDKDTINKGTYKIVLGEIQPMRKPLSVFKFFADTSLGGFNLVKELKRIHKILGEKYTLGDLLFYPDDICVDSPAMLDIEYGAYSERKKNKISFYDLKLKGENNSVSLIENKKKKPILLLTPLSYFGSLFSILTPVISGLRSSEKKAHFPRVEIDNFIFQREHWLFLKKYLFYTQRHYKKKGVELWLELEKWRRKEGIPKQFFLKIDSLNKPVFIDFENYFAIETLIKFCKRAKEKIYLVEMLPGPEGLWLKDRYGRYTSEFRLILYKF